MAKELLTLDETARRITEGQRLLIAGDETLLARLPAGEWIAGTIPYFMTASGGVISRDRLYVDQLPSQVTGVRLAAYSAADIDRMPADGFANGFSVIIAPATSEVHLRYAAEAPEFPHLFDRPVVGWIAGVHLDDLATNSPKVFSGAGVAGSATEAVVLHAELPTGTLAAANIVNLFTQGEGPVLTFDEVGFSAGKVYVDGEPQEFAGYLRSIGHDVRLPMVADYFGAMINVAFQAVPDDGGPVTLYGPVFDGIEYRLAAPVGDYVTEFEAQLPSGSVSPFFTCNCILNFLYSELEGRVTPGIGGPITFGEIAYQLLNQTMVYLTLHQ